MNSKIYSFNLMYKQVTTINSWNYKLKVVKWSQFGKSKKYSNMLWNLVTECVTIASSRNYSLIKVIIV